MDRSVDDLRRPGWEVQAVRRPRFRFTIRRLMVAVAIAAVLMAVVTRLAQSPDTSEFLSIGVVVPVAVIVSLRGAFMILAGEVAVITWLMVPSTGQHPAITDGPLR
jgi:hypothetical protein